MGVGRLESALDDSRIRVIAGRAHGWQHVPRHQVFLYMQSDLVALVARKDADDKIQLRHYHDRLAAFAASEECAECSILVWVTDVPP
jgi:hypothetical protein